MKEHIAPDRFFWALQAICTFHRKSFSLDLAGQPLPGPWRPRPFVQRRASHKALSVFLGPSAAAEVQETLVRHPAGVARDPADCTSNTGVIFVNGAEGRVGSST